MLSSTSKFIIIGLSVILGLGILRGPTQIKNFFELKKSSEVLAKAVRDLEDENAALKEEVTRIRKSKSYANKILKDKYHMIDQDETIVFFPE